MLLMSTILFIFLKVLFVEGEDKFTSATPKLASVNRDPLFMSVDIDLNRKAERTKYLHSILQITEDL